MTDECLHALRLADDQGDDDFTYYDCRYCGKQWAYVPDEELEAMIDND